MNKSFPYLYFIIPVALWIVFRLFGFDGLYAQDPYEYMRYSHALKEYFNTGNHPGDYFWPVWYPLTGALLSFILPNISFCLQFISVISVSLVCLYSFKIIDHIFKDQSKNAGIYIGLTVLLSPFLLRFGVSIMADLFTLATLIMGIYFILQFIQKHSIVSLMLAAFLFSISFMSRYGVVLLFLPFIIYAAYIVFKNKLSWYYLPLTILIGTIPLIPHFIIRAENSAAFISHDWLTSWSPIHFFQRSFTTRDGSTQYPLANIIYAFGGLFHPRYFMSGLLILLIGFKKFKWPLEIKLLLVGLFIYIIFLAGIPYQNNRFLLLAFPFLVIICFIPTIEIIKHIPKKWVTCIALGLIIAQVFIFGFSFQKVWNRTLLEKEVYAYVVNHPKQTIYTMDLDISLKGRGHLSPIYNIFTSYYEKPDTLSMVIFNTTIFSKQWANKNPMKNWEHFNEDYQLIEVKKFSQGWSAYEFK